MAQTNRTAEKGKIVSDSNSTWCRPEKKGCHGILRTIILQQAQTKTRRHHGPQRAQKSIQEKNTATRVNCCPLKIRINCWHSHCQNPWSQLARNGPDKRLQGTHCAGQRSSQHVETKILARTQRSPFPDKDQVRQRRMGVRPQLFVQAKFLTSLWQSQGTRNLVHQTPS